MKKTNADEHFDRLLKTRGFRIEYSLLQVSKEISKQIKQLRELRGLTQKDLARTLDTKQSRVSQMEDPLYAKYSLTSLARLADALKCDLKVSLMPISQNLFISSEIVSSTQVIPTSYYELMHSQQPALLMEDHFTYSQQNTRNEFRIAGQVNA